MQYTPLVPDEKGCYNEADSGFYYRGLANTTQRGPCQPWSDATKMDYRELYDYVGLEDNYCRNSLPLDDQEAPWCYSGGVKTFCGIPLCEGEKPKA